MFLWVNQEVDLQRDDRGCFVVAQAVPCSGCWLPAFMGDRLRRFIVEMGKGVGIFMSTVP